MTGRDALDEERVGLDPDTLEATDDMAPEDWIQYSDEEWPVTQAGINDPDPFDTEAYESDHDNDPWFPEFLTDKVRKQFCIGGIPHPSDVANPAFRLPGRAGQAVQHLAQALSAQDALQARLAGDPYALRLVEELTEGLGMAQLTLWVARSDEAAQDRVNADMVRRAAQTFQATVARRQRGEPKRQWAIEQRRLHPEWSWTMLCQQVEAEFGMSEGAGRTVLASIRHLVDPKMAANCNDPKAAA